MKIDGWKYYNHAAIPTTAPHTKVNLEPIENNTIWKKLDGGYCLLARWSSDWDCGYETEWWYCIKDSPFDLTSLKAKRRYEINKGKKNFRIEKIDPMNYINDLYMVTVLAYSAWPEKYRPVVKKNEFNEQIKVWKSLDIFAAFSLETDELKGYALLNDYDSFVEFSILRTIPEAEKLAINAALVEGILENYKERFDGKFYINDGSRTIHHETAFQDYLEKYFNFRKAYCRLNIKYRPGVGLLIKLLYPFRRHIDSNTHLGNKLLGVLKMEDIRRNC